MIDRLETEQAFVEGVAAVRGRRDLVTVEGPDSAEYLQGQLSQDILGLQLGSSAWSLLLQPQGKIDAWLRVTRVGDQVYWLDMDEGAGSAALARLQRFLLRTKADLALSTVDWIAVRGPAASQLAPANDSDGAIVVIELDWPGAEGFDLLGIGAEVPAGVPEGDAQALEGYRIARGVPTMGREIVENTIPAELGIVDLSADFSKGCYVGQELVARVDSRGNNTPRTLHRVDIDATAAPELPALLLQNGETVGSVTSAASVGDRVVALASVSRKADLDGDFRVAAGDQLAEATLRG